VWRPVVLTGLIGLVLIVGVAKRDSLIGLEREGSAAVTRESTYMRASFTYVSWEMFKDKPFLGFGFGQFPREKETYLSDRSTALHLESIRGYVHHNTFLSVLTETGLVGFIIYLAMLATWTRNGWRLWNSANAPGWFRAHGLMLLSALLCYTAQMVFHDVTYSPIDNSMIFLLAGIAAGLQTEPASATFKTTKLAADPLRSNALRSNATSMGTPVLADI
jgi:O-antigen ligase